MRGTAAAASAVFTVMRTSSEPARANALTCCAVDSTSAVSVLVIDCTTMGAPPPTFTVPTWTGTEERRVMSGPGGSGQARRLPGDELPAAVAIHIGVGVAQ